MNRIIFILLQIFAYSLSLAQQSNNSSPDRRYDVKVVLKKIEAVKVDEGIKLGDNEEDLKGQVYLDRYKFGSKSGDFKADEKVFWEASFKHPEHIGVNSPKKIEKEILIVQNITYNELISGVIVIDGQLRDDEFVVDGIGPAYECDCERNPSNSSDIERRIKLDYSKTVASINKLEVGKGFSAVEFGDDKYFEMNFYEVNKDHQGSHIRFWFQLLIKVY